MKCYHCSCGNEIFFENSYCTVCNSQLGFIPDQQRLVNLNAFKTYRSCQNRPRLNCNWLVPSADSNLQCIACRLTRTIPNLGNANNLPRWAKLEATKRRAMYSLLRLKLPIPDRQAKSKQLLLFDFLEDKRTNRYSKLDMVFTGHANGIITINAAEADDSYRSAAQHKMQEAYRTLLGHFRHELGHFYWLHFLNQPTELAAFRELFADERKDYQTALKYFYRHGPQSHYTKHFISAYASSHPLEDWAECWAHYLHITDTLETAAAFGLIPTDPNSEDFSHSLTVWMRFSVMLNALNRSMGVNDPYPFVISPQVEKKLHFIANWVQSSF
jgi:hypothetical protein